MARRLSFCWVYVILFDVLAVLAPSRFHLRRVLARVYDFLVVLEVDFGKFWDPPRRSLVTIWILCAESFWRSYFVY